MSYPKRGPAAVAGSLTDRTEKNLQRMEQMRNLLLSKFRAKFGIKMSDDKADHILQGELNDFIQNDQFNEASLLKLERRLSDILGIQPMNTTINGSVRERGNSINNAQQSQRSSLGMYDIQNNSNSKQQARLGGQFSQPETQQSMRSQMSRTSIGQASGRSNSNVMRATGNQVIQKFNPLNTPQKSVRGSSVIEGNMTPQLLKGTSANDDEHWNKIVSNNLQQFHREQEEAKLRSQLNKQSLKDELQLQVMAQKRAKEEERRQEIEYMKLQKERNELEAQQEHQKNQQYKQKVMRENALRDEQLQDQIKRREQEQQKEKAYESMKLQQVQKELQVQEAILRKRNQSIITENRRSFQNNQIIKETQKKLEVMEDQKYQPGQDLFQEMFIEKQHASYQKRMQSDQKVDLIKDKLATEEMRRTTQLEQQHLNSLKKQSYLEKQEDRKKQELKNKEKQIKKFLDQQIQEKQAQKVLDKFQENQVTKVIYDDVKVHEEQEKIRKAEIDHKNRAYKEKLEKQIEDQKIFKGTIKVKVMTDKDIDINKRALEEMEQGLLSIKKPF
ncbi:UNKNOWN [Stylonychia lemnae]|uniref:Uncharacterized protein n=1 Tax=Stylonychia lemnae TaxID=5949 RepID=A0A077ZXE7_STYLE|nr:UNKNOWN [Stylonychia lemnae]|eukprot:CDW74231.1 UNKNOWN [Stylonychia lemnae]